MIRVFIDTDIVLDLFLDRQPHLENTRMITRNIKDYKNAIIPVKTPESFLDGI